MTKTSKIRPLVALLIPAAPDESGEIVEGRRELSLAEARDRLASDPQPIPDLTSLLRSARLVAWHNRPAILVEDLAAAPYVRYFVRFKGERGLARCPQCGKWFVQSRPDQIYDTVAHREAHRVIRWRAGIKKNHWLTHFWVGHVTKKILGHIRGVRMLS